MNSVSDIWQSVLNVLSVNLTSVAIDTWFSDCQAIDFKNSQLVLYVPSSYKKSIIEERFLSILKNALRDIFAGDVDVLFLTENELEIYNNTVNTKKEDDLPYHDEFTFERFVVGNSNKFAHAAAKAVANDEKIYNPLFIYGESGLGKTHLLYAIRHQVHKNHPDYNIVYVKGDDFTNELISAIQSGRNIEFREKYRKADLFLIDDIQFIAGKESTQEEFFHTFNALYESNHQIVFTSDRPPNEILRLTDRLKTRFESGLLADIQPPDYETRMAIIRNKATQLGLILQPDVMDYIAENITLNVRQIEGSVKKIKAYQDLMNDRITMDTVSTIIKDMFKEKSVTPEIIIEETGKYYNLSMEDLKGQSRTKNTALARQISMYLIRKITGLSLKDIGNFYEGRDHSTVLNSIKKVENELKKDPIFAQTVKYITTNITSKK